MNACCVWCSVLLFMVLYGRLAGADTDGPELTSESPPTTDNSLADGETTSSTTSSPLWWATERQEVFEATGTTEMVTQKADSTTSTNPIPSHVPTMVQSSAAPSTPTAKPVVMTEVCLCDLTPDFCDIGCCCDVKDCDVADLRSVFTDCPEEAISGVCIDKWLMFKANVNDSLVTVTDSLFCVQPERNVTVPQTLPALSEYPAIGDSYHFSPPITTALHTRPFYRAGDVILTYFTKSSVRSLLRQPSPGVASSSCVNRNPAKFLKTASLSCTRVVTPQSCVSDPSLSAQSYFSDLNLIKLPVPETAEVTDLLIQVSPLYKWPAPSLQNDSCLNVVSKVQFVIRYTGSGEITNATVNVALADVAVNQALSQTHTVQFQLATPRLGPPRPTVGVGPVGVKVGSPVIVRVGEAIQPLTVLGMLQGGECSLDSSTRVPILFTHNTVTGCTFRSPSNNCSELRSRVYEILQGQATPELMAMNSGAQPEWTQVISQQCAVSSQDTCESDCLLPRSLSVQVLWARMGLQDLPQNYILGAKYLFHCHNVKCPIASPLVLTTEVRFADTTVLPEAPRGVPQPNWKFPFGFFSREAELDGHTTSKSSDLSKVKWSAMLFTVMMMGLLELFTVQVVGH